MPAKIEDGKIVLDSGERLVMDGIMKVDPADGKAHLIGTHCKHCGDYAFPPMTLCANCDTLDEMEEALLPLRGKIVSYTCCRQVLPGFTPGYILAYIQLEGENSPLVIGQMETDDPDAVKMGMTVEMGLGQLKVSMEKWKGKKLIGPKFKPVAA